MSCGSGLLAHSSFFTPILDQTFGLWLSALWFRLVTKMAVGVRLTVSGFVFPVTSTECVVSLSEF